MDFLKLTPDKLDPSAISDLVAHESCGAVAIFAGTTRDNFEGKQVVSLEYEAYDEMAKKEMARICHQLRQLWPDIKNIAMYHRLGLVPVKEASVVIAISSPHRKTSLDALPYALDELKKSVPVWKKELYKDQADEPSGKNKTFDFSDCPVIDDQVPSSFVQINVDEDEIQRRIQAFIERKRSEANENNVRDFTNGSVEDSCARVNSRVTRFKDSKGRLRVRKVKNESGPMDTAAQEPADGILNSIDERLRGAETFLRVDNTAIPKDVYQRLKFIEDHIADLKTVSPEYSQFLAARGSAVKKKIVYSLEDLDRIIQDMETESEL